MGYLLTYFDELTRAMEFLAEDQRIVFLGQCVGYPGNALYKNMINIPAEKRIELPVVEDMQMGMSTGLALGGLIPVTIYPRFDFLVLASNQLVNHLDKLPDMTVGRVRPKVIIRVCVGSTAPLYPGPQHCSDHTEAYKQLLKNVEVVQLNETKEVFKAYEYALNGDSSTLLIEYADHYAN